MAWMETKWLLKREGVGKKEKDQRTKKNLFLLLFSFTWERNLKYAKMLTFCHF